MAPFEHSIHSYVCHQNLGVAGAARTSLNPLSRIRVRPHDLESLKYAAILRGRPPISQEKIRKKLGPRLQYTNVRLATLFRPSVPAGPTGSLRELLSGFEAVPLGLVAPAYDTTCASASPQRDRPLLTLSASNLTPKGQRSARKLRGDVLPRLPRTSDEMDG
jgi:hypothetical protein